MNQREIKLLQDLCTPRQGEKVFSLVDLIQKKTIPASYNPRESQENKVC